MPRYCQLTLLMTTMMLSGCGGGGDSVPSSASDDVGVTSVTFLVDDGAIQGSVQKSPSDGSYSLQIPSNLLAVGDHSVSALTSDAAGNTATSAAVNFRVGSQPATGPDTTAPTVTAAVEGNFGLVKLTAIARDNVRIDAPRTSTTSLIRTGQRRRMSTSS